VVESRLNRCHEADQKDGCHVTVNGTCQIRKSVRTQGDFLRYHVPFGVTYDKIGTIQRRLAWPLHKDDTLVQSGSATADNIYAPASSDPIWCILWGGQICVNLTSHRQSVGSDLLGALATSILSGYEACVLVPPVSQRGRVHIEPAGRSPKIANDAKHLYISN
jgi:hypothetical protein